MQDAEKLRSSLVLPQFEPIKGTVGPCESLLYQVIRIVVIANQTPSDSINRIKVRHGNLLKPSLHGSKSLQRH